MAAVVLVAALNFPTTRVWLTDGSQVPFARGVVTYPASNTSPSFYFAWGFVANGVQWPDFALERRIRSDVALAALRVSAALEPLPLVGVVDARGFKDVRVRACRRSGGPRPIRGFGRRGR